MSRYHTVSVGVTVSDIIGDIDTSDLLEELRDRGNLVDILDEFDLEEIQAHIERNGGFTLENVPTEELQGALAERNVRPILPVEIVQAFETLLNYFAKSGASRL